MTLGRAAAGLNALAKDVSLGLLITTEAMVAELKGFGHAQPPMGGGGMDF